MIYFLLQVQPPHIRFRAEDGALPAGLQNNHSVQLVKPIVRLSRKVDEQPAAPAGELASLSDAVHGCFLNIARLCDSI